MPVIERREFPAGVIGYCVAVDTATRWRVWCFRIGSVLIDTGCPLGLPGLVSALARDGKISHVLFTHHHEDHTGNADAIRAVFGACLIATQYNFPLLSQGFTVYPYQRRFWGAFKPFTPDGVLELQPRGVVEWQSPEGLLRLHHSPGHSHDGCTIEWPEGSILCTGDSFIHQRIRYIRADENLEDTRLSLQRLLRYSSAVHLLCAHNPMINSGRTLIRAKIDYLSATGDELFSAITRGEDRQAAITRLLGPENRRVRLFTAGDVSTANLGDSLLGSFRPRPSIIKRVGKDWAWHRF